MGIAETNEAIDELESNSGECFADVDALMADLNAGADGHCDKCGGPTRRKADILCPSCGRSYAAGLDHDPNQRGLHPMVQGR